MASEVSCSSSSSSVGVYVWWDFGPCPMPEGVSLSHVSQAIKAAVRANGMNGPVQISAAGRLLHLEKALSSAGITMIHVSKKGQRRQSKYISGELYCWFFKIPKPAHLFVITDRNLATTLSFLRQSDYNVLLASNQTPDPGVLCAAVSIVWRWDDLVTNGGENSIAKYYNQPPNVSWYGHYDSPLEDHPSFVAADEPNSKEKQQQVQGNNDKAGSFSPPSTIPVSYLPSREQEEESKRMFVSVLWDIHSCPVPEGVNLLRVSEVIRAAIRANHMRGPIEMRFLVVESELDTSTYQALYSTGWSTTICIREEAVYRHIKNSASMETPPGHLFLITDRNFDATLLQELRMHDYNILLASSNVPPGVETYASIVWRWNDLVEGEKLIGQYLNQPPWLEDYDDGMKAQREACRQAWREAEREARRKAERDYQRRLERVRQREKTKNKPRRGNF